MDKNGNNRGSDWVKGKNFFPMRTVKQWHRLSREAVQSLCSFSKTQGFQDPTGWSPEQPSLTSQLTLLWEGLGLEVSWTPYQPELFCYSVILHGFQVAVAPLRMVVGQDVYLCPGESLWETIAALPFSLFAIKKDVEYPATSLHYLLCVIALVWETSMH